MDWDFLFLVRRLYKGADAWGKLYVKSAGGDWEFFSYSYELPWKEDGHGRSLSKKSRIKEGTYKLSVRSDGPKGWRMELMETGHRRNIQVHRAHKSMYIEGCILPVHFEDFRNPADPGHSIKKGQQLIQTRSIELVQELKKRYDELNVGKDGHPTITISALLPAMIETKTAYA